MPINSISMNNYRMYQNGLNPYGYGDSTLSVPKNLNIETNSTLVDTNQTSKNITQPRLSLQPQQDSVSFSSREKIVGKEEKKGLSTGAKWGIGLGILATGAIATLAILSKRIPKHLENLYKEKLVPKTFDKELVYNDVVTKEEAIKYAKEVLGVKEVDEKITLEALNFANSGITDVVNKNIGQGVFIPTKYVYTTSNSRNYIAYVKSDIMSKDFGELGLNKKYFDESFLNNELKERFGGNTIYDTFFKDIEGSGLQLTPVDKKGKNLKDLIKNFRENPNSMSLEDKRRLWILDDDIRAINATKEFNYADFLKENKIDLDISSLKTPVEIRDAIDKYCKDHNRKLICNIKLSNEPKETIYHEMGHLQDFAKNLKEIDLKGWNISLQDAKNRVDINEIDNRWSGTTYGNMKKLFNENPEKFKKQYPDLYEFLTNKEKHNTALKVSSYASTGIGEFVAETYAEMIAGVHLSDDVMALYKKYNGPLPNGFK